MHKFFATATCVAFVLTGASAAVAGTMGNGGAQRAALAKAMARSVTVLLGPEGHRVIVTIATSNADGSNVQRTSYAYNPANGNVNPTPQQSVDSVPIKGTVVKGGKNPGGNYTAQRVINDAVWAINPAMTAGNYNIVVTIPANAINVKGTGASNRTASGASTSATTLPAKAMDLTFHITVDAKGNMRIDSSMAPTATAAASGTTSQQ